MYVVGVWWCGCAKLFLCVRGARDSATAARATFQRSCAFEMHSWPGALLDEPVSMISVSRADHSLHRPSSSSNPLPPAPVSVPPASVKVNGREVTLWHYGHLEQVDLPRLRQRAALVRDAFQQNNLPDEDALRSGDRRRLMAWILDAQLALARLGGLDPSRQWSVTASFGAPADLAQRDALMNKPASPWDVSDQSDVLIPFDMDWKKPWRPPSTAGSSRGSSRASNRSDATSIDPRHFVVAPPKQLLPSPAGEQRYHWPWRSQQGSADIAVVAAGAPSRPSTAARTVEATGEAPMPEVDAEPHAPETQLM